MSLKIAIVGATGLVGRTVLKELFDFGFADNDFYLFASKQSEGKTITIDNKTFIVHALTKKNIKKFDVAFFCAGGKISKDYAQCFVDAGAIIIDNSSTFRRMANVPLVVPEINGQTITSKHKIIANPNCSTIGLVYLLNAFSGLKIKRIVVSTYQAVSGAGQKGILDLQNNYCDCFDIKITDNLIPQIDKILPDGNTFEEDKLIFEPNKILNSNIKISATAVRVPISNCHSESVNIEFENDITLPTILDLVSLAPNIVTLKNGVSCPMVANGSRQVFVSRIRQDNSQKNTFNFFISFDNVLVGAATNAVKILKILTQKSIV